MMSCTYAVVISPCKECEQHETTSVQGNLGMAENSLCSIDHDMIFTRFAF
jgi:hypothetical protein